MEHIKAETGEIKEESKVALSGDQPNKKVTRRKKPGEPVIDPLIIDRKLYKTVPTPY